MLATTTTDPTALYFSAEKLACKLAWRFYRRHPELELDDLLQVARMTCWRAALQYDPERGFRFTSYSGRAVWYELIKYADTVFDYRRKFSGHGEDGMPLENLPDPATPEAVSDWPAALLQNFLELPERTQEIVRLYVCQGYTLCEVGQRMGISRERVRQVVSGALARLRWKLERRST